ncbi:hypothetical protein GCM10028805_52380 [Spirosoma harenae]
METLAQAQTLLEQLESSQILGITFLDSDLRQVSLFHDDPALRESILEYQRERVRQLRLSQNPLPYATLDD